MSPTTIIETLSLVAPLGLCFHDAATGERVIDGLSVSVYPASQTIRKKRTEAFPNRSGVYVLHKADGLEEFTRGAGDTKFWQKNPPQKSFIVEVIDNKSRFQPFQFTLEMPLKGIYRWENIPPASPNKSMSSIPLYSAPSRPRLGGMAVVRAELRERKIESPSSEVIEKPASFAVLEARFNGNLVARGIADREGRIVLMFPALSPQSNPLTSPPSDATRISLAEQVWNLDLTLKYEPEIFQISPSLAVEDDREILPDLRLVLAQKIGKLWTNAEQTERLTTDVLQTGRELVLRTRAPVASPSAETAFLSYLFVSPA